MGWNHPCHLSFSISSGLAMNEFKPLKGTEFWGLATHWAPGDPPSSDVLGKSGAWSEDPGCLSHGPCVLGSKLTLFPYNRGWSSTQFRRGLYTHYMDSLLKVGWLYPQYKELIDPGSCEWWENCETFLLAKVGILRKMMAWSAWCLSHSGTCWWGSSLQSYQRMRLLKLSHTHTHMYVIIYLCLNIHICTYLYYIMYLY